jgi:hypothetical protein
MVITHDVDDIGSLPGGRLTLHGKRQSGIADNEQEEKVGLDHSEIFKISGQRNPDCNHRNYSCSRRTRQLFHMKVYKISFFSCDAV